MIVLLEEPVCSAASGAVSNQVEPDIANLKTPKCHETDQIDFP